ncbi:MAG: ABC transporter ATP-binding protein [Candidatus Woesearchaeota archaeon]
MARAKRILWHVWQSLKYHQWGFALTFVLFGATIALIDVYAPTLIQRVIDALIASEPESSVYSLFALYAGVLVGAQVLFRIFDYVIVRVQKRVMKRMQDWAFMRMIEHDYAFFVDSFAGSIVAKVKRYARGFERIHDQLVFNFVPALVTIVGVTFVLSLYAPMIALLFLVWFVVFVSVTFVLVRYKIPRDLAEAAQDSKVTGALADAITNVLTIHMFARSSAEQRRFESETAEQEAAVGRAWYFNNFVIAVQSTLIFGLQVASIYLAIGYVLDGSISVGTLVLVQTYIFMVFGNVWRLGRAFSDILKSGTDMDEMVELMDAPIAIADPDKPETCRITKGHIEFDDVSFTYDTTMVFENLSFTIRPGERVGIVGTSGAGKSTITKLLLRFMDVTGGAVRIDGQNVRAMRLDDLRLNIAYVPQEPILFHRTLSENIRYADPKASEKRVLEAARKAHAHEFISKLPNKYDTLVGERGVKLSGGERQRVAIARAMLKNAPILVLDEATSSLDAESERLIRFAFEEASKDRTTIVIAHRLATVKALDRIIVLEKGRIVEQGTHRQLLRKKGRYFDLYTHQRL